MAYLLLGIGQLIGLLIIPFGWPGLWLQLAALGLFGWATTFEPFGGIPLVLLVGTALVAELFEAIVTGGRVERRARRRGGFAGLAGGVIGAALGYPFPLLGSLFGALVGALAATALAAFATRFRESDEGNFVGEVIGMGVKAAAGVVIAAFTLLTLMR